MVWLSIPLLVVSYGEVGPRVTKNAVSPEVALLGLLGYLFVAGGEERLIKGV